MGFRFRKIIKLSKHTRPHELTLAAGTTDQTERPDDGMHMGSLLLWGILGLFAFLLAYGLVTE